MKKTFVTIGAAAAILVLGACQTDETSKAEPATAVAEAPAPTSVTEAPAPAAETAAPATEAPAPVTEAPATPAPENTAKISKDEFAALTDGMTYAQATATIGGPGELLSESDLAGIHTAMYMWEGANDASFGANANAMFQNDALISKSQFGL